MLILTTRCDELIIPNWGLSIIISCEQAILNIIWYKDSTFENLQVSGQLVVLVSLCILNVLFKAQERVNRFINLHKDDMVQKNTEHDISSEVVHEHVVGNRDLMLGRHEVEDGNEWHDVEHAQRGRGEQGPSLRSKNEPKRLGFSNESWQEDARKAYDENREAECGICG
jgi:hypothetical protein